LKKNADAVTSIGYGRRQIAHKNKDWQSNERATSSDGIDDTR
jgi:hypothetical protein